MQDVNKRTRVITHSTLSDIADLAADCIGDKGKCLLFGYTLNDENREISLTICPRQSKPNLHINFLRLQRYTFDTTPGIHIYVMLEAL